jgi:RimJ/RimL family protein N-acetyltransferase
MRFDANRTRLTQSEIGEHIMKIADVGQLWGDGFLLRPIVEEDAELIAAASVSDVPDWTFIPRNLGKDEARAWIRRGLAARENGQAVRFVIQVEDRLAGTVGAEHPYAHDRGIVETFYFVLPEFRRRGLANAGLRLVDEWVQRVTPELRRLQLHVIVGNRGSGRVAELAGYRFEGVAVHQIPPVNGYGPRDAEVYGIAIVGSSQPDVGGVLA